MYLTWLKLSGPLVVLGFTVKKEEEGRLAEWEASFVPARWKGLNENLCPSRKRHKCVWICTSAG